MDSQRMVEALLMALACEQGAMAEQDSEELIPLTLTRSEAWMILAGTSALTCFPIGNEAGMRFVVPISRRLAETLRPSETGEYPWTGETEGPIQ